MQLCREIFGLFHSKFITTPNGFKISNVGLALVREKFLNGIYGNCPRILCNKQIVLPAGLSYDIKYSRVKVIKK
jgi:casein kinase II subunit beta